MDKHGHDRKGGKRKGRDCLEERGSTGLDCTPISGVTSDASKSKRRRHSQTLSKSDKKRSSHSSSPSGGGRRGSVAVTETISSEDYFKRSAEFRKWLTEKQDLTFSDMNSEESRKMFNKFVRRWNAGKLDEVYYRGGPTADVTHDSKAGYRYLHSFHSKCEDDLSRVAHSVGHRASGGHSSAGQGSSHDEVGQKLIGPTLPSGMQSEHETESAKGLDTVDQERRKLRLERKAFRKDHEMVLDELLPRETGRERRIEKKKMRYEAQKEREVSPDLTDSFSAQSSGHDIKFKLQKIKEQRERRTHAAKDKVSEYHSKERAKAQAIMELAKASKKEGALWR